MIIEKTLLDDIMRLEEEKKSEQAAALKMYYERDFAMTAEWSVWDVLDKKRSQKTTGREK